MPELRSDWHLEIPEHRPKDFAQVHRTLFLLVGGVWAQDYLNVCVHVMINLLNFHLRLLYVSLHIIPSPCILYNVSVASSEYETVSMFEETGAPDQYKSTCMVMYYCSSSRNLFLCKIYRQCMYIFL